MEALTALLTNVVLEAARKRVDKLGRNTSSLAHLTFAWPTFGSALLNLVLEMLSPQVQSFFKTQILSQLLSQLFSLVTSISQRAQ